MGSGIAPNQIAPQLGQLGIRIEDVAKVVLTHGQTDHIGVLTEIKQHGASKIHMYEKDSDALRSKGIEEVNFLRQSDVVQLGARKFNVLKTPGHTAGSICLHDSEIILTGDTAFPGGYFGRTDPPSGNSQELVGSLNRLADLSVGSCCPAAESPYSPMLLRI